MTKRILSMLVTMTLLFSTMAMVPAGAEENPPYYEINVFSQNANFAGVQSGWFGKLIRDKFNIGLNITATNLEGGSSKYATLMASGDLGELLNFGDAANQDFKDARDAGMFLDMTDNDLLKNSAPYISENFQDLLKRAQLQYSVDGTSIYALAHDGMAAGTDFAAANVTAPALRYDLYKAVGAPKISNMFDYLPVIKQMQELYPVNADGQPTYGVSYFPDWDGDFMTFAKWFALFHGYDNLGMILLHGTEDKTQTLLDPESWYMKGVRFMYEANQMGLLDPDSLTQTYTEYQSKVNAGRVLFTPGVVGTYNTVENTDAGRGMYEVPHDEGNYYFWGVSGYGGFRTFGIGAKAQHPDRIMAFIDWICTDEGAMEMRNGPKGLTWDVNEAGKPYLTDFGVQCFSDGNTPIPDEWGGGTFEDGKCKLEYPPRTPFNITKTYGESIVYNTWTSYLQRPVNQVLEQWRKDYGELNIFNWAKNTNHMVISQNQMVVALTDVVAPDMDMQLVQTQVGEVIKQYSWKMAYATNEEEYKALFDQMVEKATGLGYQEITDFYLANAAKIMEKRAELF